MRYMFESINHRGNRGTGRNFGLFPFPLKKIYIFQQTVTLTPAGRYSCSVDCAVTTYR